MIDYIKQKREGVFAFDRTETEDELEPKKGIKAFEELERFGYTVLQKPVEALNIIYPSVKLQAEAGEPATGEPEAEAEYGFDPAELIGKQGLSRLMKYSGGNTNLTRYNYEFRPGADFDAFGNIFHRDNIGKYSAKISTILDNVSSSDGIILVYSQFIDGGLIPIALALESMGFSRHGNISSLFNPALRERGLIDKHTGQNYVMITGDKTISPDNQLDLKACTGDNNIDGGEVKVILISQAAAEGLDFKNIRQVHILDAWYNMNRIEQIIGRGVRHCSHRKLPLAKRNVQIFLHGSEFNQNQNTSIEPVDLYIYRLAEMKSIQIGKITRILKSVSVDCILNSNQQNFREEVINKTIKIKLSNGRDIDYRLGDKPFTAVCDYMDNCYYKCATSDNATSTDDDDKNTISGETNKFTYSLPHIELMSEKIIYIIKELMKERHFYYRDELDPLINLQREYSREQIDNALIELTTNKNQFIADKKGRIGRLEHVRKDDRDMYVFQPIELTDPKNSIYKRTTDLDVKPEKLHKKK